jgi:AcrB/AcrD/AcrF family
LQREGEGDPLQAATEAGFTRFRPVLMTALAMIIGMIPMALGFGDGGEESAPLGRAVVGWFYDIGAKLNIPELDKQLEQARADPETAKANLSLSKTAAERWQGLVKTRSVSQQSTDQALDNLSATQASVDSTLPMSAGSRIWFRSRRSTLMGHHRPQYRYRLADRCRSTAWYIASLPRGERM